MSDYLYGDWYCKPANEAEAKEIIERAMASGANNRHNYCRNSTNYPYGVVNGRIDFGTWKGTRYTIEQVREKFPLPGERVEVEQGWSGEGLPPVDTVCEFRKNPDEWVKGVVFGHRHCNNGDVQVFIDLIHSFDWSGDLSRFRPIRSERERWVEDVNTGYTSGAIIPSVKDIAGFIFDALKSGDLKAPE